MRGYSSAASLSLAALAVMAAAGSGPYRPSDPITNNLRRAFGRILTGIQKANDYGYPNISRQVRRQIERKSS